ncbi:hypothetical protein BEWA_022030 [Theileria equi strain WA]|uniref:Uncharacterized protein n=1 Tax=Theileria equi strain WA TaxID=1537102 RepID=L0AUZ0_THEEQ|nr:hypothetical protein BEWA_022030 [Theileria equi strain WA]AFZ79355.1 hypothetical protein BEWA_022030 [Theileria equi strain WA]|eukprot:XP_004829021.1 hypothetical protein BEWA_022030 [Theileria equi strain WA]
MQSPKLKPAKSPKITSTLKPLNSPQSNGDIKSVASPKSDGEPKPAKKRTKRIISDDDEDYEEPEKYGQELYNIPLMERLAKRVKNKSQSQDTPSQSTHIPTLVEDVESPLTQLSPTRQRTSSRVKSPLRITQMLKKKDSGDTPSSATSNESFKPTRASRAKSSDDDDDYVMDDDYADTDD